MADSGEEFVRISHRDLVNLAKLRTSGEMSREERNYSGKQQEEKSKKSERQTYMPGQKRFNRKRDEAGEVLPTESAMSPEIPVNKMAALRSSPGEWSCAPVTSVNRNNELQLDKCGKSKFVSLKGNPAQRKSALQDKNCHTLADSDVNCRPKDKNSDCTENTERQQSPVLQVVCTFSSDQVLNSDAKVLDYNPDSGADKRSGDMKKDLKLEQETLKLEERRERKRGKKPDIQLYVPKGRQQMLLTKDSGPTALLHGKLSDVSCAIEPVVTGEGVTDVNTSQHQKQLVTDSAERRGTVKHESVFQDTISKQENMDNCWKEVKKVGGTVRKRRQQKSKGRAGDFHSQLDSRIRRKVVHDGRSPWQKHQHKWHASGVGNGAVDDDISEVEELEWDHQADLDLDQSEMKLLAATQKQDSDIDAAQLRGAELQHMGSLVKPAGKKTNKKPQRKYQEGKPVVLVENRMTNEDDLCLLADKATKPKSDSLKCENMNTISPTDLTNKDENFEGKFDLLVITNSKKLHSLPVEGSIDQYGYEYEYDDSQPLHVDDGIVNADDNNSTQSPNSEKLKMQIRKKNVSDIKSFGTKYDSSRRTGTCKTNIVTCEDEMNCRISVDSKEKADKNNAQELASENPQISDKNFSTRVGGIIRLPAGTTTSIFRKPDHASSCSRHAQQHGIKGHTRCRAATRRTLWDPSRPIKGAESSPYFNELPDACEHVTSEANASREYEHVVPTRKLQLTPHPYYGSLASFGQCLPVENYSYRYPGPPCFDGSSYDGSMMSDLYFQGYDQNCQPLPSSELTTLVREATMFDNQLTLCLSQGINSEEALKRMAILRKEILTRYEQVMLLDLDFCNQQNIGDALWRSAFYQVIEVFRKQIKDSDTETKNLLLTILDESLEFFEKLLQKVQVKYNFSLEKHLDADGAIHECVSRTVKLGLVACQRIMMCLGDLARYKELVKQSSNYGRARSFFQTLDLLGSILEVSPQVSLTNPDYLQAEDVVQELRVVNSAAERGVALMQEYNSLLTKDEEQTRFALLVIKEHRKLYPSRVSLLLRTKLLGPYSDSGMHFWYMKAQQIAPKNGKPYNQLAVLALYTRRKLDAVYYYMRSLAATNPLLTARESLMSLFDEARRKMEYTDRNRQLEKAQRKRMKAKQFPSEQPHRLEIWILPDGSSSQDQIRDDENDSDDLLGLSVVELNKRFVLSFLHVHGKLFTKIGMETFPESVGRMLQEFHILIRHSPSPIGWMRLLQLMTINMFAIENTIRKEANCLDDSCRSVMQEQAMQLGLEMFGLLIEQCIHLLHDYRKSYGSSVIITFGEDLHQILPGVKAWSDWMICHSNLWNPPPAPFDHRLGPNVDVWRLMADLFNIISELNTGAVVLNEKKTDGCKPVILREDVVLAGFIPLLSITHSPVYVLSDIDKDLAQDCLHIDKLRTFAEIVYGLDPAILSYSAETCCYTSIVASEHKDDEEEAVRKIANVKDLASSEELKHEQEDEGITIEGEVFVESCPTTISEDDGQEHHISQLKARKQELTRKFAEQMKKQECLQAAIESSHQDFRRIELEIRPVFLVLDTNCLIDHLRSIQKLLATRKYTFIIPLVVINELDGLAKNLKESCYDTIEQAEMVRTAAEMAVQFLEAEFERRNHHLRAITSKGSTLDTIAFRSEEPQDAGTNDDLILSCCLRHCQDKARDFMPKSLDEPIRLYRDVVLLTNDRNLRLKAHLHNVPVKDIPSFIKWAKIS